MGRKVLYVCTGNRFRSLFAEAYTRKNHSDGFDPVSAGTEAGKPIIEEVKKEMQRREVWSYSKESPEQLTGEDVSSADTVICMKKRHAELLKDRYGA
ncbi:MAG: low molecular weight phosphatase family protein, partial [Candidatus Nanohaloarchaea archaeon]